MAAYVIDGCIGADLDAVKAGTGTSNDEGNEFILGSRVRTSDGGEYMYVHASAAVTKFQFVGIDESFEAAPLTTAMVDDGWMIGEANQVGAADNDFFWVAIAGPRAGGTWDASVSADVDLHTSTTAGQLQDETSTGSRVRGVVLATASGTSVATALNYIFATHPHSDGF